MSHEFVVGLCSSFIIVQVISWLLLVRADSAQLDGGRKVENRVSDFLRLDNDFLRMNRLDCIHLLIGIVLDLMLSCDYLSLNDTEIFDNFSINTPLNAHLAAFMVRTGLRKLTSYIVIGASHYV